MKRINDSAPTKVDALYKQIWRELFSLMLEDRKRFHSRCSLASLLDFLERIADHATNIGESVVYLVTGRRPDLN
ncbi:PhoU domain-containing protein [Paenibacillus xylaniclasticus]|uniref:PhoU domain-containing protein n=1 Tax=Paenibacillus xylaniclasticus TaxID=588083 RepID=UPI000FD81186|nr:MULTISPECIES: PhoU domain-containing protein [Paenibacillus]GFN30120.1 hypothetical protein PCURB6_03800 [Paenibacillus curdlanolyticus]